MAVQYKWEKDEGDGKWGWTQTTVTGSEVYSASDFGNGKVISRTWVDTIKQYVGSTTKRVHTVVQDTYAEPSRRRGGLEGARRGRRGQARAGCGSHGP
jgi:hypothetical protein